MLDFQNIRGHACHHITFALFGEKGEGQFDYFFVHRVADVSQNAIPQKGDKIHRKVIAEIFQQKQGDNYHHHNRQGVLRAVICL